MTIETVNGPKMRPVHFAGRTIDLTLFAVVRAIDVVVGELWLRYKMTRSLSGKRVTVCIKSCSKLVLLTYLSLTVYYQS